MKLHLMDSLKTGHAGIDHDHELILDTINALHGALHLGNDLIAAQKLFDDLTEMCQEHFHHEEQILSEADYPNLLQHVADHERLLRHLHKARTDCKAADATSSLLKCFEDVVSLVIDDIVRSDMAFVSYLEENRYLLRTPMTDKGINRSRPASPLAADRPETSL